MSGAWVRHLAGGIGAWVVIACSRASSAPPSAEPVAVTAPEQRAVPATSDPGAFVYSELQLSVAFADAPWRDLAQAYAGQPGLLSTTWLSGVGNRSVGSMHSFDTLEHARAFVAMTLPGAARKLDVAQTSRMFDAPAVREASLAMDSVYWGHRLERPPGAFVYTEVQVSVPFAEFPWRQRNPVIRQSTGFLAKTWLSGVKSRSVGGIYAFDTVEHAKRFAIDAFASNAGKSGVAFYTRVFDAAVTEAANRESRSPFYVAP